MVVTIKAMIVHVSATATVTIILAMVEIDLVVAIVVLIRVSIKFHVSRRQTIKIRPTEAIAMQMVAHDSRTMTMLIQMVVHVMQMDVHLDSVMQMVPIRNHRLQRQMISIAAAPNSIVHHRQLVRL